MANHFTNLSQQIQKTSQNGRIEALIDGIAQQMQNSNNAETQQLGQELQGVKSQLVQSCQQSHVPA